MARVRRTSLKFISRFTYRRLRYCLISATIAAFLSASGSAAGTGSRPRGLGRGRGGGGLGGVLGFGCADDERARAGAEAPRVAYPRGARSAREGDVAAREARIAVAEARAEARAVSAANDGRHVGWRRRTSRRARMSEDKRRMMVSDFQRRPGGCSKTSAR